MILSSRNAREFFFIHAVYLSFAYKQEITSEAAISARIKFVSIYRDKQSVYYQNLFSLSQMVYILVQILVFLTRSRKYSDNSISNLFQFWFTWLVLPKSVIFSVHFQQGQGIGTKFLQTSQTLRHDSYFFQNACYWIYLIRNRIRKTQI